MSEHLHATKRALRATAGVALLACAHYPPHGFASEPSPAFVEIAEQGCAWDARWPAFHHSTKWSFGMCMAGVGLYRGYTGALAVWSAPPAADLATDLLGCAEPARAAQHEFDQCAAEAGLTYDSAAYPYPYLHPDADRNQVKHAVHQCMTRAELEAFDRSIGQCLYRRGWTVHHIDSRGRAV